MYVSHITGKNIYQQRTSYYTKINAFSTKAHSRPLLQYYYYRASITIYKHAIEGGRWSRCLHVRIREGLCGAIFQAKLRFVMCNIFISCRNVAAQLHNMLVKLLALWVTRWVVTFGTPGVKAPLTATDTTPWASPMYYPELIYTQYLDV